MLYVPRIYGLFLKDLMQHIFIGLKIYRIGAFLAKFGGATEYLRGMTLMIMSTLVIVKKKSENFINLMAENSYKMKMF